MDISARIRKILLGSDSGAYRCWMCGMEHENPVAYLWHINACELERTGRPIMLLDGCGSACAFPHPDNAFMFITTIELQEK